MNSAAQKIEKIQSVFLETQLFYANHDPGKLPVYLESLAPEFRSIGYECASMAIALKDFEINNDLLQWQEFAEGPGQPHKAQVYIGLGWALAKKEIPYLSIKQKLDPLLHYRVADGCGYYNASFRQRKTLVNQEEPGYIPGTLLPIYYQGIGRSLWYSCNTDITRVSTRISSFPAVYHSDLWRGAGIAIAYVGGCSPETLEDVFTTAGDHQAQLAYGAALAAKSRKDADTFMEDTHRSSHNWFQMLVSNGDIPRQIVYEHWLNDVEFDLAKQFVHGL